jgi:hypothetical protein
LPPMVPRMPEIDLISVTDQDLVNATAKVRSNLWMCESQVPVVVGQFELKIFKPSVRNFEPKNFNSNYLDTLLTKYPPIRLPKAPLKNNLSML